MPTQSSAGWRLLHCPAPTKQSSPLCPRPPTSLGAFSLSPEGQPFLRALAQSELALSWVWAWWWGSGPPRALCAIFW